MSKAKKKTKKTKKKSFIGRLFAWIVIAVILINVVENFIVIKTSYTVKSEKFQGGFSGATIVQLSDIHLVKSEWQLKQILGRTKSSKPDIIVLTGDLIDSRNYENEEYLELTKELCSALVELAPVYYIYGNHEMRILNEKSVFSLIEGTGIKVFNNDVETIHINGGTINLLGVSDPAYDTVSIGSKESTVSGNLSSLTSVIDKNIFTMLLSHRPELFEMYTQDFEIDLTLTGHAHGGQIRIPFSDIAAYAPGQGILPKYTKGIYESDGKLMLVSRGIGESRFPFRVFDTPEVVEIKLETALE